MRGKLLCGTKTYVALLTPNTLVFFIKEINYKFVFNI